MGDTGAKKSSYNLGQIASNNEFLLTQKYTNRARQVIENDDIANQLRRTTDYTRVADTTQYLTKVDSVSESGVKAVNINASSSNYSKVRRQQSDDDILMVTRNATEHKIHHGRRVEVDSVRVELFRRNK